MQQSALEMAKELVEALIQAGPVDTGGHAAGTSRKPRQLNGSSGEGNWG